jgi:hypothetical protein
LILVSATISGAVARAGAVRTLDGRAFDGEVRLDRSGTQLIVDTGASSTKVELADVLDAILRPVARATAPDRGVVLVDDSVVAGTIEGIDERVVRLRRQGVARPIEAPIERVARVMFQPASAELAAKAPAGNATTTGVLLANGDFFEGKVRSFDGRTIRVDSLLFGPAAFDVNLQAVQLVLRPSSPTSGPGSGTSVVRLTDGSSINATGFNVEAANLRIISDALGSISVRLDDVAEIHAGGGRVQPLAELTPTVKANGGAFAVDATSVGLSAMVAGMRSQRTVTMTNGAQASYPLNGEAQLFTCRAGVPRGVLPTVAVRFIVLLDGHEAWRSGARSSLDEPVDVSVKLGEAKTLTLAVESSRPAGSVGAVGAWCDPALVAGAR